MLAYLRKGDTFAGLAAGFGIGTATAWRYVARPWSCWRPGARSCAGHWPGHGRGARLPGPGGTLIPADRVAADRPSYSGKHRRHGMNLQVIASPGGDIVWVSGPLPGAVHDLTAARIWGVVRGAGRLRPGRARRQGLPRRGATCAPRTGAGQAGIPEGG